MAKLRLTDKAQKLLTLLMAMRLQHVRRAAGLAGYGGDEISLGWSLLRQAAGSQLDAPVGGPTRLDDGSLALLDVWENDWYPVISATLEFNYPDVHAVVFQGLRQTSGQELVITVGHLLDRLEAIPKEARQLLAKRNVTAAVLADARLLLERIATPPEPAPPVAESEAAAVAREAALAAAETAMWAHYREWSEILRARVKNARYRRLMGFGTRTSATSSSAPTPDDTLDVTDPVDDDDSDEG